jgi:deazaflavin-dependent oxidoreductase (nitroreductase family)
MSFVRRFELWVARTSFGAWMTKLVAARIDPVIFRLSGGRFTSLGPVILPQLVLTTTGRKTGKERDAQLVYTDVDGVVHIVASNFGGERHPAWYYNLEANPEAFMQVRGERIPVRAEPLGDEERAAVWPRLVENIPNYAAYRERTDRNIRVYRLIPSDAS